MNYDDAKVDVLRSLLPHVMSVYDVKDSESKDFGKHYIVACSNLTGVTVMIVEYSHGFEDFGLADWWERENGGLFVLLSREQTDAVLDQMGWYVKDGRLRSRHADKLRTQQTESYESITSEL